VTPPEEIPNGPLLPTTRSYWRQVGLSFGKERSLQLAWDLPIHQLSIRPSRQPIRRHTTKHEDIPVIHTWSLSLFSDFSLCINNFCGLLWPTIFFGPFAIHLSPRDKRAA
jgi:hypothetical protein